MAKTKRYFRRIFRIRHEQSFHETYLEVTDGTKFKGYNFWILSFSMFLACIGLNTDNLSAIIGAMLISPLMGPIQSFAFGLAINDLSLKRISVRNWLLMAGISLLSSVLYFVLTPFDFDTSVLKSFKTATVFDILLAFFGGLAGFIGLLKKEGTKVIAGVAVATACMPPLCTAGYGIAHLDWEYTFGGLYFYLINCLFIGLASFLVTRLMRVHRHTGEHNSSSLAIWTWRIFIITMILPGVYLAINRWEEASSEKHNPSLEERILKLEKEVNELKKR